MAGIPKASSAWTPGPCSFHGWHTHELLGFSPLTMLRLCTKDPWAHLISVVSLPLHSACGARCHQKAQAQLTFVFFRKLMGTSHLLFSPKKGWTDLIYSCPLSLPCPWWVLHAVYVFRFLQTQGICQPPGACVAPRPRDTCQAHRASVRES